jgi:hypothetical protein
MERGSVSGAESLIERAPSLIPDDTEGAFGKTDLRCRF